jgi:hypothetical protein
MGKPVAEMTPVTALSGEPEAVRSAAVEDPVVSPSPT